MIGMVSPEACIIRHTVLAVARSSRASTNRMVSSGRRTMLARSSGSTRTRCGSSASEGSTVAGSSAAVINVRSVTCSSFDRFPDTG